jgi:4-amino-4-deoxy-L-arabinose transferase-like glycosyltransferase
MSEKTKSWLTIACLWLVLLVLALIRPLSLPDEGRYADIGRWMFISDDWLVPRLNGIPFFHKPPLLYWLQAEVFHLAGVHVWTARLVTAAHALIMLTGVYLGVRRIHGEITARKVSMVLGTSVGFLVGGQYINHDFLVATWITAAIGLFAIAMQDDDKPDVFWARLGFLACGLGVLSKGLIGIVLPGMVMLTWVILTGKTRQLIHFPWLSGLLIWGLTALPWMLQVQAQFSGFFDYFIIGHHFSRFSGDQFNNRQDWWFYPGVIGIFMFPWVLFIAWNVVQQIVKGKALRGGMAAFRLNPWTSLPWIWLGVILLFFSLPTSKLIGYILPVIPPVAILAVLNWDTLMEHKKSANAGFWGICGFSLALATGANFLARYNSMKDHIQDVAQTLTCLSNPEDKVYVFGEYPFDLPFLAQRSQALIVIENWDEVRKNSGDNWRRVFFEGADFDHAAGQVLQSPEVLKLSSPDVRWLVTPAQFSHPNITDGWQVAFKGHAWWLWRSGAALPHTTPPLPKRCGLVSNDKQ